MPANKDAQQITKAKGRPMLTWVGKHPLEKVEWFPAQEKEVYGVKNSTEFNKLFWGDNLQVLSHLLKDHRGKIDLIYIDPPFDSKADYVRKVKIKGEQVDGLQESIFEEKQYTDIWENDEYLQFLYERLLLLRELLNDSGTIYIHLDWHKIGYIRLIMDEIFGEQNFLNEVIWQYDGPQSPSNIKFGSKHDTILRYAKSFNLNVANELWERQSISNDYSSLKQDEKGSFRIQGVGMYTDKNISRLEKEGRIYTSNTGKKYLKYYFDKDDDGNLSKMKKIGDVWNDIPSLAVSVQSEKTNYPTQKPERLMERIIKSSSVEGGLILDCFSGSGTTIAVAQKLGRKWIGCDINMGAIQTSTKRIVQVLEEQEKGNPKLFQDEFKGNMAFKVLNVNDYDIFKNEIEAKEIVMEMYGVEPIKRSQFDGILDSKFVKIMPLNKVLNKLDLKTVLKNIEDTIDTFTPKTTSKGSEEIYEEGVIIICSGAELDVDDFLKKENKTGVKVNIRDILNDKKSLIFKKKPEARIEVKAKDKRLSVVIQEFYSPILMRKLELENEKIIDKKDAVKVGDFKQIIDSVAIDVDYDGKLFNAEIIDLPDRKELIKAEYNYTYDKSSKNTVAIKIVDVLGEEYFETFEVA